jgi:hypothetical protein
MNTRVAGPVTLDTPLGDALTFHSMGGLEALSRLSSTNSTSRASVPKRDDARRSEFVADPEAKKA